MQQWEYLELFLSYYQGKWEDSLGRQGELVKGELSGYASSWKWQHSGTLLNELGQQGWELVGVEAYPYTYGGGSIGLGLVAAKWLFKRQSG